MMPIIKFKSVFALITGASLALCSLSSCSFGKKPMPEMNITFMDFGSADAILITTENHTLLVDSANKGDGKDIYEYCSSLGRTNLDCFILTHFDKDHVGGAKAVIGKFDSVSEIIQPDYEESSSEYEKYAAAAEEKGITPVIPDEVLTFSFDDAVITVYPPLEEVYSQTNNYSLAVTVEYGDNAFLLAGDAEKVRIKELISQIPERDDGYDIIKMPHHGRAESNTDKFVEYFKPLNAVITCSEKEPADDETLNILKENDAQIYNTINGNVVFSSNGISVSCVSEGSSE